MKKVTVSWLSGLLSAEIFINTMNGGGGGVVVQIPPLAAENMHFLRSGSQEAALVMNIIGMALIETKCELCNCICMYKYECIWTLYVWTFEKLCIT